MKTELTKSSLPAAATIDRAGDRAGIGVAIRLMTQVIGDAVHGAVLVCRAFLRAPANQPEALLRN